MKRFNIVILLFLSSLLLNAQSITDLDFLIGTWEITETILPNSEKQYQERGTRICEYYLNGAFIKCESKTSTSHGKEREYVYLINYDQNENCFWATALASDFSLHGLHQWFLDPENNLIRAITPKNVNGDRFFRGTISYGNNNLLIWDGWASKFDKDKDWIQIFRDVARKIK